MLKLKNRSYSDKLYFLNFAFVWAFVIACYALTALSGLLGITDMSVVSVGIPAAFAELGLHTAFIVWKAKVENCRKYKDVNLLSELESEASL
jgi:hypothetical protein